jgi:hypothetical protein
VNLSNWAVFRRAALLSPAIFCDSAFRVNFQLHSEATMNMNMRNVKPRDNRDLSAKAVDALVEAQSLPPGPERTKAMEKATKLADTYKYLFFSELKPPE